MLGLDKNKTLQNCLFAYAIVGFTLTFVLAVAAKNLVFYWPKIVRKC